MAWYSSLGNVKLSRTSLGFLTLTSATGFALGLGLTEETDAVFVSDFLATADLGFKGALRGALAGNLGAAFRTAFLTVRLTGFAATGLAAAWVERGLVFGTVFSVDMFSQEKS